MNSTNAEVAVEASALPKRSNEARSRKKKLLSTSSDNDGVAYIGNGGIYDVSDSGDSSRRGGGGSDSRSKRLVLRKKRVHRSRVRKTSGKGGNAATFCLIGGCIFIFYLMVCLIFFRNLPEGEARGMRGLVQRTKSQVAKLRGRDSKAGGVAKSNVAEKEIDADIPNSPVPIGLWPVSIRNEDGKFEDILHPGFDEGHEILMSVPTFWANDPVAIHENKLMSRERALSIGTCITPDPITGSNTRGDACPLSERTVFVGIASYRDWQCRDTGEFPQHYYITMFDTSCGWSDSTELYSSSLFHSDINFLCGGTS